MKSQSSPAEIRSLLIKTIIALLAFSWIWQGVGIALGGLDQGNDLGFALTLGPVMFSPLIVGLIYTRLSGRRITDLPWKPKRPFYLLLGMAIPTCMALLMTALWQGFGLGASNILAFGEQGLILPKGPYVLGPDTQGGVMPIINLLATMTVFAVLNSVATIGEEGGWRGVFQADCISQLGTLRGIALLGFIWGIWHIPVNLTGYNYPSFPVFGAFVLFPMLLILHSIILAWLTIEGKSLWPAVLFHAGINSVYIGTTQSLWADKGLEAEFRIAEFAIVGLISAFAWMRLRRVTQG